MSFISIIGGGNAALSGVGSNSVLGQVLSTCSSCYDPDTGNPCGEDTTLAVKVLNTEKGNSFDAAHNVQASLMFVPPSFVSLDVNWTAYLPYNLPNLTGVGGQIFALCDLKQSPQGVTVTNFTVKNFKVVNNKLEILLSAPNVAALNSMVSAIGQMNSDFVGISVQNNQDVQLFRQFLEMYDNPAKLELKLVYDYLGNIVNPAFRFWQYYTKGKALNLKVLNQKLPKSVTIKTKLQPVQEVSFKLNLVMASPCVSRIVTKKITVIGVRDNYPIPQLEIQIETT
jgi:hypothetical protein